MNYLLDTNLISEWTKPHPNAGVIAWFADVDEDRTFLSVVTLMEVRYGIDRLPTSIRKKRLNEWLESDLPQRFEGRLLSIDAMIAELCGLMIAKSESRGRPVTASDGFLAATAKVHGLALVTRNVADFQNLLSDVLNPFS